MPLRYLSAKMDSRCMDRTAAENMVMGWVSRGMVRSTSNTYWGTWPRCFQSSTTLWACSAVGISPVRMNHQKDSTVGYSLPGHFGRASKVSGMVLPRKRIPSSGSR